MVTACRPCRCEEDTESLAIIMRALLPFIGEYLTQNVPFHDALLFVRKIDGLLESADFPEEEREKMFSHYGETVLTFMQIFSLNVNVFMNGLPLCTDTMFRMMWQKRAA